MFAQKGLLAAHQFGLIVAQVVSGASAGETPMETFIRHVVAVLVYSVIGIVVFAISIWLFCRLSPFSVRKEIEEDQNTSLGIILGSMFIGIAIIIAAAIS